jgi:adenylate cyclase
VSRRSWRPIPDIVIVDIDEASLARLQDSAGRWPWLRAVHVELLARLLPQQPRAVIFDILFAEPYVFRPDSDEHFRAAVRNQARVYLPTLDVLDSSATVGATRRDRAIAYARARTSAAANPIVGRISHAGWSALI